MLRSLSRLIAGLWLLLAAGTALSAPILIVDVNGKLTGAHNVEVNGILYDVEFRDGTCADLFSGCDNPVTDFPFTTPADAFAAAAALLAQVFVDGTAPALFDSNPALTLGCGTTTVCGVFTPYALADIFGPRALSQAAENRAPDQPLPDAISPVQPPLDLDTTFFPLLVWAVWNTVPEPPTYACLLLAAGIALAMSGRRNRNRAGQHQRL